MKFNIKKPSAGTVWTVVGLATSVIGMIASNAKHNDELNKLKTDTVAETTKQVLESLSSKED